MERQRYGKLTRANAQVLKWLVLRTDFLHWRQPLNFGPKIIVKNLTYVTSDSNIKSSSPTNLIKGTLQNIHIIKTNDNGNTEDVKWTKENGW